MHHMCVQPCSCWFSASNSAKFAAFNVAVNVETEIAVATIPTSLTLASLNAKLVENALPQATGLAQPPTLVTQVAECVFQPVSTDTAPAVPCNSGERGLLRRLWQSTERRLHATLAA